MADGPANTVTILVAGQLPMVYDMMAVPGVTPVTTPPATVATPAAELLHTPPVVVEDNVVVRP